MAGGEPAELRAATTAQRAAAAELVHTAVGLAGATHADSIRNTLDAAVARPELTGRLTAGTLTDTLDAPAGFGFGFDTGATVTDLDSHRRSRAAGRRTLRPRGPDAAPTEEDRPRPRRPRPRRSAPWPRSRRSWRRRRRRRPAEPPPSRRRSRRSPTPSAALVEAQQSVDDATENRDDAGRELDAQRAERIASPPSSTRPGPPSRSCGQARRDA